jgi:hypothetical protein
MVPGFPKPYTPPLRSFVPFTVERRPQQLPAAYRKPAT